MSFAPRGVEIKAKGPEMVDQRAPSLRDVTGLELQDISRLQRENRAERTDSPFGALEKGVEVERRGVIIPSLSTPFIKR